MHKLYGTYLIYLVEQALKEHDHPLSTKEIALSIEELPTAREQSNFEIRVRRALNVLSEDGKLLKERHRIRQNLVCFKYKIIEHEQKPEFS